MINKAKEFTVNVLDKKIAWSTFVQYLGKLIQLILASLSIKIIAILLDQNGFGVYGAITEYVLFFSVLANLGIFGNVVRRMSVEPKNAQLFFNSLLLRAVTGVFFFVLGVIYLKISGADAVFIGGSTIFFGALFFEFITTVCDGMLQANYLMGRANIALIAGRIVNILLVFLLLKIGSHSISAILFASLLGSLVTTLISLYFVRANLNKNAFKIDKVLLKSLLISGLPFGIINITNNLYFRFLPDFFAHQTSNNAQFATFNIAFRISQVLSLLSTFLMFSILPGFEEYLEAKDFEKFKIIYKQAAKLLLIVGVLIVAVGSFAGKFSLELLTHKKYFSPEFSFILLLMLILTAVSYGYDLVLITIFALEKEKWFLRREFVALAICVGVYLGYSLMIFYNLAGVRSYEDSLYFKYAICLAGPILAESYMVICGLRKIKRMILQK